MKLQVPMVSGVFLLVCYRISTVLGIDSVLLSKDDCCHDLAVYFTEKLDFSLVVT